MRNIKDILNISAKREKTRGTLWAAVQARRIVEFFYHGSHHAVEPFALGITRQGKADNESIICYQLGSYSDIHDVEGWKLYRIAEIDKLKVSPEQFTGDRPGYDPDNIDMVEVYCCVQPPKTATDKTMKIRPPPEVKTPPVYPAPRSPPPRGSMTHNELMRQFRFTHPASLPELYVTHLSDLHGKPLLKRVESKNTTPEQPTEEVIFPPPLLKT
jgi:hypothetical protein